MKKYGIFILFVFLIVGVTVQADAGLGGKCPDVHIRTIFVDINKATPGFCVSMEQIDENEILLHSCAPAIFPITIEMRLEGFKNNGKYSTIKIKQSKCVWKAGKVTVEAVDNDIPVNWSISPGDYTDMKNSFIDIKNF